MDNRVYSEFAKEKLDDIFGCVNSEDVVNRGIKIFQDYFAPVKVLAMA